MTKWFSMLFVTLAAALSAFWSTPVWATPYDFNDLDPLQQYNNVGDPTWPEHYAAYDNYIWAMWPSTVNRVKWYAPSGINSYAATAAARWNAINPTDFDGFVEVTTLGAAALDFQQAYCPVSVNAVGCMMVTQWSSVGPDAINIWNKATIYIPSHVQGTNGWTAAGRQGAYTHEAGHVIGLGDQYNSSGGCNRSVTSVMDAFKLDGSGYVIPCDTEYTSTLDGQNYIKYWNQGNYQADGIYYESGFIKARWKDYAYNDRAYGSYWYWRLSAFDPATLFYSYSPALSLHGTHNSVSGQSGRRLYSQMDPVARGAPHGRYIQTCGWPIFNSVGTTGDWTCSGLFYYP